MILQSLKRLGRFELTYSIYLPNHIPNTCLRHIRRVSNLVKKNTTWLCDMANIQHESNINPRTLRFYIPSTLGSLWIYTYIYICIYIYRYTCIIYIYIFVCSFAVPLSIFGASFASEFTMAVFPQYCKCDRTNLPFTKICNVFMRFMSSSHTHTMLLFFRMQLFINNCITILECSCLLANISTFYNILYCVFHATA